MNTRSVDPRTIWAVMAMEAGLALPIMSLPTQGDRFSGVAGPLLLLMLLPLGFACVYRFRDMRDPSWRLSVGILAALGTRLIVSVIPEPGLTCVAIWLTRSVIPAMIGIALWWRGGALCVAELSAAEVRTEFSILALCMLAVTALVRPFVLADPLLLGASVGLFAAGGLVATALSRQDAAEVVSAGPGRTLATTTALVPVGLAVVLVSFLQPGLLARMWTTLGYLVELALTPLGWLLAWLASLFPRGGPPPPLPALARPTPPPLPDAAALSDLQDRTQWVAWLILGLLMFVAAIGALMLARLLLANWIGTPTPPRAEAAVDLTVERSGTAAGNARDVWGWLMAWLRSHFGRGRPRAAHDPDGQGATASGADAWAAYQALLGWAERQGLGRTPSETTRQLQARLSRQSPETAAEVDLVTSTYEWERYGQIAPIADRLRRVRQALAALLAR